MYAYTQNNPVMFVDPSGEFAILTTILITTLVGFVLGGGFSAASQLIENDFNFSAIDWKEVGVSAMLGAALGAAYGLGAGAGAILMGKATALWTLTAYQSAYLLASTAAVVNFTAGVAAYSIRHAGDSHFSYSKMVMYGFGQTGKGMVSFLVGAFFAGSGNWMPMNWSNMMARAATRQVLSFIPSYYLDYTLMKFH